jgi:hypothetical protein
MAVDNLYRKSQRMKPPAFRPARDRLRLRRAEEFLDQASVVVETKNIDEIPRALPHRL